MRSDFPCMPASKEKPGEMKTAGVPLKTSAISVSWFGNSLRYRLPNPICRRILPNWICRNLPKPQVFAASGFKIGRYWIRTSDFYRVRIAL